MVIFVRFPSFHLVLWTFKGCHRGIAIELGVQPHQNIQSAILCALGRRDRFAGINNLVNGLWAYSTRLGDFADAQFP